MTFPKLTATLIGSFAAMALLPAMAASTDGGTKKSVKLSIAKYDLNDPEHAKIVYGKIRQAAKRVCRFHYDRPTLAQRAEEMQCRAAATTQAVSQLNAPELTVLMEGRADAS